MKGFLFCIFASIWLLFSCSAEKVKPIQKIKPNTNITYSADIAPFISVHCISCHDASTGINLSDYTHVKMFAQSGQLIGTITSDPNFIKMPPYETLSTSDIQLVEDWITQGMNE